MQGTPVLIVTQDPVLWQSWQKLSDDGWMPLRGLGGDDIKKWHSSNRQLVVLDNAVKSASPWSDADWASHFGPLRVLVLSANPSDAEGQKVLAQGASGYAHTHLPVDALSRILRSIQDGSIWMGRSLLQKLLQDIDERLPVSESVQEWRRTLSPREAEVAQLAAIGKSNPNIADALSITERTVRAHLSAVFEKLGVQDRLQLALKVHGIRGA